MSCACDDRQVRLVADENGRFGHPLLRESSVLALSKFMCISEAFCDRNLRLLFTSLERSKDTAVSRPGSRGNRISLERESGSCRVLWRACCVVVASLRAFCVATSCLNSFFGF